ncbi:MAG: hypothetical protein WA049_13280 [Ferribacterium limneticum]
MGNLFQRVGRDTQRIIHLAQLAVKVEAGRGGWLSQQLPHQITTLILKDKRLLEPDAGAKRLHAGQGEDVAGFLLKVGNDTLAQFLLGLDEVAANLPADLVVFDHRQFFGHVEGEVIVEATLTRLSIRPIRQIWRIVLSFNKTVLLDAILDPVREVATDLQRAVQVAGIAILGSLFDELAGEYRDKLLSSHDGLRRF